MAELNPNELRVVVGGASRGTTTYTVHQGDTLDKIAYKFNTDVKTLMELNNILDPSVLRVGMTLIVPV